MSDEARRATAEAQFFEQLSRYEEELRKQTSGAQLPLESLRDSWLRLCALTSEGNFDPSNLYLVHAFGVAVDVGRADEAERIYLLMPLDDRLRIDAIEASNPGTAKIW